MIHRYIIFELEILALQNWIGEMTRLSRSVFNPDKELYRFLQEYTPNEKWLLLDTSYFRHTQTIKVIYLKQIGMSYQFIQAKMGMSPNYIQKVLREGFLPQRPDNSLYDELIEEWKKLRPLLPNEIFIKYLK
jgi:hypothetical protein